MFESELLAKRDRKFAATNGASSPLRNRPALIVTLALLSWALAWLVLLSGAALMTG